MRATFAMFKSSMKKSTGMKKSVIILSLSFIAVFTGFQLLPLDSEAAISRKHVHAISKDSLSGNNEEKNSRFILLYDDLDLGSKGLSRRAFEYAMQGFEYLRQNGQIQNDDVISIVDFSLPSSSKRLFVIDLVNNRLLYCTYVAHGHNSGLGYASQFSNKPESNKSSLGFYRTGSTYQGTHGYSLKLEGLERGINDNADRRDIVVHGAAYVSEALIQAQGYIGRSLGCPALPERLHKPIIDKIKNGTCLFIYGKDRNYPVKSKILRTV